MKKSPLNDAKWANRDPGTNMSQKEKLENRGLYNKKNNAGMNLVKSYLDWNDDGKITTSDIVKEGASWMVGGPVAKGLLRGGTKVVKFLKGALKRESSSPFNHCASDMMHSGGWQEMRKHNSPGTTGNKEGIKHNEKMRKEIGTFKMPHHSPLNKGHEVNQDSIAAAKAWKEHKAGYLKKPNGQKEYDMEKGEFYYSPKHKKLRLIPTDDGEVQDRSGIEKWQLAPDRKSSQSPFNSHGGAHLGENHDINVKMVMDPKNRKRVNEMPQSVKDSLQAEAFKNKGPFWSPKYQVNVDPEDGVLSNRPIYSDGTMLTYPPLDEPVESETPLNKKGEKDACYHKVKSRVKVWPSAYASGQLVQCRKAGAANWGNKSKKK